MSSFTIRVLLHRAGSSDYASLAQRLRAIAVVDVIRAEDGTWYRLPPGEYNYEGEATSAQLMAAVTRVADAVKPPSAVLVTQAMRREWRGLEVFKRALAA